MSDRVWIGGLRRAPFYLIEPKVHRPDVVFWYDATADRILEMLMEHDPDQPMLGRRLAELLREDAAAGQVPPEIRVQTVWELDEIRSHIDPSIRVRLSATPEIDALLRQFTLDNPAPPLAPPSYLAGGRIAPELIGLLFESLRDLRARLKGWPPAEAQPFRLDIPELGVEAFVAALFATDEGLTGGFVIFESLDDYLNVRDQAIACAGSGRPVPDIAGVLRVAFVPAEELPDMMRREALTHGWPVGKADAYPFVVRRDSDGLVGPLSADDIGLAIFCAEAFSLYCRRNKKALRHGVAPDTVSMRGEGIHIRLSYPFEAEDRLYTTPPMPANEPKGAGLGLKMELLQLPPERKPPPKAKRPSAKKGK